MNNRPVFVLLLVVALWPLNAGAQRITLTGETAPVITFTDTEGETRMLGGKPVYLKFWATWCVKCREEMPHFNEAFGEYGGQVDFIAVNVGINDSVRKIARFQERFGMEMPVVFDDSGDLSFAFEAHGTPTHVIVGTDGTIVYYGFEANEDLEAALAAIAAE